MRRPASGRKKREFAGGGPSLTEFSLFGNYLLRPDAGQLGLSGSPVFFKIAKAKGKKAIVIRNKKQLQFQIVMLITALEQAVDYQSRPQSNDPAPELHRDLELENRTNFREVKALVDELRRVNGLLEKAIAKSTQVKSTQKPVVELRKHLNSFLNSFAKGVGTGAGWLVVGAAATILHNTGYFDPSILLHRGH